MVSAQSFMMLSVVSNDDEETLLLNDVQSADVRQPKVAPFEVAQLNDVPSYESPVPAVVVATHVGMPPTSASMVPLEPTPKKEDVAIAVGLAVPPVPFATTVPAAWVASWESAREPLKLESAIQVPLMEKHPASKSNPFCPVDVATHANLLAWTP